MTKPKHIIAKDALHYLLDDMDMSFADVEDLFFELGYVPQNSDGRVMLSIDELKKHLDENVVEGMVRKYIKQ